MFFFCQLDALPVGLLQARDSSTQGISQTGGGVPESNIIAALGKAPVSPFRL